MPFGGNDEPYNLHRAVDRNGRNILEHAWRLDALDEWRGEIDKRVARVEGAVSSIEEARRLAEALDEAGLSVKAERRREHQLRLTTAQKLVGLAVGLAAVADFVRGLVMG